MNRKLIIRRSKGSRLKHIKMMIGLTLRRPSPRTNSTKSSINQVSTIIVTRDIPKRRTSINIATSTSSMRENIMRSVINEVGIQMKKIPMIL